MLCIAVWLFALISRICDYCRNLQNLKLTIDIEDPSSKIPTLTESKSRLEELTGAPPAAIRPINENPKNANQPYIPQWDALRPNQKENERGNANIPKANYMLKTKVFSLLDNAS